MAHISPEQFESAISRYVTSAHILAGRIIEKAVTQPEEDDVLWARRYTSLTIDGYGPDYVGERWHSVSDGYRHRLQFNVDKQSEGTRMVIRRDYYSSAVWLYRMSGGLDGLAPPEPAAMATGDEQTQMSCDPNRLLTPVIRFRVSPAAHLEGDIDLNASDTSIEFGVYVGDLSAARRLEPSNTAYDALKATPESYLNAHCPALRPSERQMLEQGETFDYQTAKITHILHVMKMMAE